MHTQFLSRMKNSTLGHIGFILPLPVTHLFTKPTAVGIPDLLTISYHLFARSCNTYCRQEKPIQDCELAILVRSGISAPTTALLSVLQSLLICRHALCINYFLWPASSSCCSLQTQSTKLLLSLPMVVDVEIQPHAEHVPDNRH